MTSSPAGSGLWVRRFHPAPAATRRLVCFPHAGGSASFYFPVSAQLTGRVDVLAIQYPGRQDRRTEPCAGSIGELADGVFEALRPWVGLPLTFFGHSMGALVAYEVASRFERSGLLIEHLFVSGRRGPAVTRRESVHLLDDDGIVAEVRALSGTEEEVLADDELLRMVLPALRSDYRAVETYRGDPDTVLECPITALTGDSDPRTTVDEAREWKGHTSAAFDLKVFRGGHFYLTSRPAEVTAVLVDHFTDIVPLG
ncbi:thioesterase [Streptacidiphilus sp. PB12-B1b]|uniref:thioesterase II family protein n=1 Tax=Streptacidiphilus sp. PB12-B1b TaxID=2705012 RepID=UPI0015FB1FEF|nr:alpha/beta fold hydrolase [Streptacidiphilus sp. PB12-B1b]QMU77437.1 thioesterase [Streptacidiphilus sp. PB12-B1b]